MIYSCDFELYVVPGPSCTIDTACSSSLYTIEHACRAMRKGVCDSAIVGGSNLCLHPHVSLSFFRYGVLSRHGVCRAFDRDGMHFYLLDVTCTRAGTLIVVTIYLQLIQNRYMFRSFTVLQCSHQNCVQPVASDVEVVGYL